MKTTYLGLTLSLLLWATTGSAQIQKPPKQEYLLMASTPRLTITNGQQDSVKLTVLRSKSFKIGKSSITVRPPREAALEVKVKQLFDDPDQYMIYLITTAKTKPGEYTFAPTCELQNKSKGIVLNLIIK